MGDIRRAACVGVKAIINFETVSTLALIVGLAVGNVWPVGVGINVDPTFDAGFGELRQPGKVADHHRFPSQCHSDDVRRSVHETRSSPDIVRRGSVQARTASNRGASKAVGRHTGSGRQSVLRHGSRGHVLRPDRRSRRVYGRPSRR
jgi:hypothetical protein